MDQRIFISNFWLTFRHAKKYAEIGAGECSHSPAPISAYFFIGRTPEMNNLAAFSQIMNACRPAFQSCLFFSYKIINPFNNNASS